jgi:hypothetical protein
MGAPEIPKPTIVNDDPDALDDATCMISTIERPLRTTSTVRCE